jgi:hypothetical protein
MSWLLGACIALIGSIGSNFGLNLEKYSFTKNAALSVNLQRVYYKQPLYLCGLLLVIIGSVFDFIALGLVAQSIVAPIGSITLVTNVLFAHYWLKEQVSSAELIGTGLILVGSLLAVTFGDHSDIDHSLSDILHLWTGLEFIIYIIICTLLFSVLYIYCKWALPIRLQLQAAYKKLETSLANKDADVEIHFHQETIKLMELQYDKFEKYHPFALCALSGICGGQSVLFAKMVAELLSATATHGSNQVLNVFFFLFVLLMFIFIFIQIHLQAMALTWFDALYCVPVFQGFFISTSTIGGACLFKEFSSFSVIQFVFFPLGVLLTLYGVSILCNRPLTEQILNSESKRLQRQSINNIQGRLSSSIPILSAFVSYQLIPCDDPEKHASVEEKISNITQVQIELPEIR